MPPSHETETEKRLTKARARVIRLRRDVKFWQDVLRQHEAECKRATSKIETLANELAQAIQAAKHVYQEVVKTLEAE